MIRIIDPTNREFFARTLDQLFRLRHDCFVKERGWNEFEKDGVYEQDQYDDEHAVYLASVDSRNDLVGCIRICSTLRPHMLGEHFSHLVDGPVPCGPDIIEMSRMAIREDSRGKHSYCELLIGLVEFSLLRGMRHSTAVIRGIRLPIVQATGYHVSPLGEMQNVEGDPTLAVIMEMSEPVLKKIRSYSGIVHPVIEDADAIAAQRIA